MKTWRVVHLRRPLNRCLTAAIGVSRWLGTRFAVAVVVLIAVVGVTIGSVAIDRARSAMRSDILRAHLATVDLAGALTQRHLDGLRVSGHKLALHPAFRAAVNSGDFNRIGPVLDEWLVQTGRWAAGAGVYDADGTLRAAAFAGGEGPTAVDVTTPWWIELRSTGQPAIGPGYRADGTADVRVPVGIPLLNDAHDLAGVLVLAMPLQDLAETLTAIDAGPRARMSLVEISTSRILIHADSARWLAPVSRRNAAADRALNGERGATEATTSAGESVLGAYTPIAGTPWALMILQPSNDAFAVLEDLAADIRRVIVVGIALAAILGSALALWITRPLGRLRAVVEAMAAGALERRVGIHRSDEVGAVARAFDDMADQLQTTVEALRASMEAVSERESELAYQAYHDQLTRLPNRAMFLDRLSASLARTRGRGGRVAVLFLDLDNFKVVNDSLGHQAGDDLLVEVAQRLRASVRAEDTVCRLGGDEFTLSTELEPGESSAAAIGAAERLSAMLTRSVEISGREVIPEGSIGVAISDGAATAAELLRQADLALYRAKSEGKGRWALFDESMAAAAVKRLEIETDLRQACARGELRVVYQPIVALATGELLDFEALVRWEHPRFGWMSPEAFVPIAEETGQIVSIGQWLLDQACRSAATGGGLPIAGGRQVGISVNLSARQLQHDTLVGDILHTVHAADLDPRRLTLEITESTMMRDPEMAIHSLDALRREGIRISVDDFGTGHSSLANLKRLPVNGLKIDRSFVSQLEHNHQDVAIVETILGLGRGLGLEVTAQGIERSEQHAILASLGCARGQGHLFSPPVPAFAWPDPLLNAGGPRLEQAA